MKDLSALVRHTNPTAPLGTLTHKVFRMKGTEREGLDCLRESDSVDFGARTGVPDGERAGTEHDSQQVLSQVLGGS